MSTNAIAQQDQHVLDAVEGWKHTADQQVGEIHGWLDTDPDQQRWTVRHCHDAK